MSLTAYFHVRIDAFEENLDPAVARRELDGVAEKIPENLLKPIGITRNGFGHRVQNRLKADAFRLRGWPYGIDGRLDDRRQGNSLDLEPDLSR